MNECSEWKFLVFRLTWSAISRPGLVVYRIASIKYLLYFSIGNIDLNYKNIENPWKKMEKIIGSWVLELSGLLTTFLSIEPILLLLEATLHNCCVSCLLYYLEPCGLKFFLFMGPTYTVIKYNPSRP